MAKKDLLEELREENERLKKELEISKLERENRELREQIQANRGGGYGVPYTWTSRDGRTTITLCSNVSLLDDDKD